MYSISFDDIGKGVLVRALEKEREIYQKKLLEGDSSPGTLIMHEQLYRLTRGILYAKKKETPEEVSVNWPKEGETFEDLKEKDIS